MKQYKADPLWNGEYALEHPQHLTDIQRAIRGVLTLPIYLTPTNMPGEFRVHVSLPPGMGYDVAEQVLQEALQTVRQRQMPLVIPPPEGRPL